MKKKVDPAEVERAEEDFAAASPAEAGALAKKLNKLKRRIARGE